jgi:NTP pyrophosphatase (non-canonical NTP hydrolase)
MSKSGLTPYQDECLEILVEECGEVIQEKSKIFRFGCYEESHKHPGMSHAECLEQELGDVLAMIELVRLSGVGISEAGLEAAKQRKLKKVITWMTHTKE